MVRPARGRLAEELGGYLPAPAWAGARLAAEEGQESLEDRFTCWLCNAHHLRNVPGRKTDVADSVWIAQLVEHGLVRPQLRAATADPAAAQPDPRAQGADQRARPIQRLDKILQDPGV